MDYIAILEYIGVFAFAVSGAIVAIEEEFDVFGIYIIAIITAMGGGVLRDIVTNSGIPVFFTSYVTIPFIIAGALLAIFLKGNLKYKNLFVFIDAIGLAAFFISAAVKAIGSNYNFMLFIFAASITGVGGGVLRDIITNRKPQIFKHDIYCVAGIIGVTILWFVYPVIGLEVAQLITLVIIVLIRMVGYYKTINLPVVYKERV
ncbi:MULTISPECIES: trimeric intracellular cation channel family protein [unclassified Clostridium]|uniref:trimeric intracellular cation channel family protein n=1 Tax=Clostridium TaxID=1485 RepID=UPI001C8B8447|nr:MULTISPECIES: trimeric intracellular cation channel family protein [unclassified Clostridium]MBX9136968.1 trimeric intracellular cation channel family protein [Clostridium sp. K12(2020)]MBX9143713.1 trimeric intracellular cation channel family protein [Clostridium sp. K13]MDU2291874.1 trimeric intracellular cation channel family protein [Clostridium celatum]MDU4326674.1 trimeric intracellular cation channel family protein [Clostridium celatum]